MLITVILSATIQLINLSIHLQAITRTQYRFSYLKELENDTYLLDEKKWKLNPVPGK